MRCEGWKREGGAFTFGPATWSQCSNEATVILEVEQNEKGTLVVTKQPVCMGCWKEAANWPIKVLSAEPIK